jgi:type II secretion system protein H
LHYKNRGFTLIELLVVIVIIAMLASLASLALPNREGQQWKASIERLTATLNFAQGEALSRGSPIWVVIDQRGWRFFRVDRFENTQPLSQPEAFAPVTWNVPIKTNSLELKLGDDAYPELINLQFAYEQNRAQVLRDRFGRFRLEFLQ